MSSRGTGRTRASVNDCIASVEEGVGRGLLPKEFLGCEDRRGVRHVEVLCEGAVKGGDIESLGGVQEWIQWLAWSSIVLDEKDYLEAALHALRIAPRLSATDYGTARQRDLAQQWTDVIRGLLGEIAFVRWLRERFGIYAELDYGLGSISNYLPSDIKLVNGRRPNLNVSIKTTKLRGIWLDVPYAQIEHSDIFVLVRVGVTRWHFLAFLKKISVIRDKIFEMSTRLGIADGGLLEELWSEMPEFENIPAYVAGFFDKRVYGDRLKSREEIVLADGVQKKKRFIVNRFVGFWNPSTRELPKYRGKLLQMLRERYPDLPENVKIEFEGIGDFTRTLHFIVSSGALKRGRGEWERLVEEL
ncbi:hypothetical protein [Pyrobaculum neutrophilum]|uniref:Uncharacterized protein n=1 Tax=Pyrobaculum neutrophilum (strain DSM 2338 / JCM 9278 / NBRC 100436 / V24Sta) TaxID=444157 RepID=B1YBZ4_PYRNV|nr:hypothetical protein [Pyrobaculum neutrophilum]ACB39378.1 conserved hypothetical protein [Pyrobaculum neutrophilum V24Sta]